MRHSLFPLLSSRWLGPRAELAFVVLAGLAGPVALAAQSVSPPIAEYQERARSSFQISNTGIFPLNVVLEVRGFRVSAEGDVEDAPIDTSRVHIKLSAMSFRVPPKGTYTVFYEASADSLPAWFNIVSAMTGARTANGLNLRILLPHVVYLNQKAPLRKEQVAIRSVALDSTSGRLRVELENLGPNLGRVQQLTAEAGKTSSPPSAGFPLFPYMHRWTEIDWPGPGMPERLSVKFARFTIDTSVTGSPSP
jgi:hypothetical protein